MTNKIEIYKRINEIVVEPLKTLGDFKSKTDKLYSFVLHEKAESREEAMNEVLGALVKSLEMKTDRDLIHAILEDIDNELSRTIVQDSFEPSKEKV